MEQGHHIQVTTDVTMTTVTLEAQHKWMSGPIASHHRLDFATKYA